MLLTFDIELWSFSIVGHSKPMICSKKCTFHVKLNEYYIQTCLKKMKYKGIKPQKSLSDYGREIFYENEL